jgi:hypothetical protein
MIRFWRFLRSPLSLQLYKIVQSLFAVEACTPSDWSAKYSKISWSYFHFLNYFRSTFMNIDHCIILNVLIFYSCIYRLEIHCLLIIKTLSTQIRIKIFQLINCRYSYDFLAANTFLYLLNVIITIIICWYLLLSSLAPSTTSLFIFNLNRI